MIIDDPSQQREILTPSTLNRMARELLEGAFPMVWIEGELSNVSRPASGHLYFTLKDASAQVRCALFRNRALGLRMRPVDGMQVLLKARVSLYEGRGEFQLIVEHMEEAGEGALRRAFEQLKAKLQAEGLFENARKRHVPCPPRRLGVITSASGAAVRDVLKVLARRFPLLPVDVLPVAVQGAESAPAIVAMLGKAAHSGRYDVLLLTRGGGSLEDLWSFNEESVARAIADCSVPVVSAVGHEVDITIADFVADLRAPTPSAAAELLVPDAATLVTRLANLRQQAARALRRRTEASAQRSDALWLRLKAASPQSRLMLARTRLDAVARRLPTLLPATVRRHRQQLVQLHARLLSRHPSLHMRREAQRADTLAQRLRAGLHRHLDARRRTLTDLGRTLHAVSPLATLERGYAILLDAESGQVVRSIAQTAAGQRLHGRLADGNIDLRVDGG
ncbi:MAG TPA: exodeoxyribonuclease VII large subunit [Xanthomonadaceae bacterium]|nr:exodeoxyribonuclease VII large subunit [Xanthomonadaceae bacterium]